MRCRRNAFGVLPQEPTILIFWNASWFAVDNWQRESSCIRRMHRLICQRWPWLLSNNVDSSLSKTHSILLIWLPLITSSSLKWKTKKLGGNNFARDQHVVNAVHHFPRSEDPNWRFLHRRDPSAPWPFKCLNVGGDYIENWLHLIFYN